MTYTLPFNYLYKTIVKTGLFALLVCALYVTSYAQTINEPITWKANRFGQEHGLLQLNVKGMALDSLGFLWLGTEDGLHRFNGYTFKPFIHNPNDSTSLKDDHIRGLLFAKNTLWIATTAKGIAAYSPSGNYFSSPLNEFNSIDFKTSHKVLQHDDETLLFSVQNHLIHYNTTTLESTIIELPLKQKLSYVTDVLQLPDNKCWLSTTASGILEIDTQTLELSQKDFLKKSLINCLYQFKDRIYIGTETGIYVYNTQDQSVEKTNFAKPINCFYKKNEMEVYVGTDNGMFVYNLLQDEITPIILRIDDNRVYESVDINQIIGDERDNLWIGTDGDGLLYYNTYQKKFNTIQIELKDYPQTADISTFQILKHSDNLVLLGTKLGIVQYNSKTQVFKQFSATKDILIYTLKKDSNGDIWAGGFTSGLLKYDSISNDFVPIIPNGTPFADRDIIEILPVSNNLLWICTWSGGIYSFNTKTQLLKNVKINKQQINRARTSFIDSKGNIWLGTDEGAYKITPNNDITHYTSKSSSKLSSNRVFCINEDKLGNIWIGTNVGLTKFDTSNNTTLFYKQEGLPNDFIYSILIAENNDVWVSTNYGISVLTKENSSFRNFTTSDGLQNNEFNGKAGYKDKDGTFYFGGLSGINIFNPKNIKENPHLPDVFIESVELFNSDLGQNELYQNELIFDSEENVLTFNYAALNFLNPEKCDYTYKMEGFDNNWRPLTKNRNTTYTNLDPGHYTFMVRASNDAGKWNGKPAKLRITIVPPWYETTIFRLIFIVVFLLSGILFYFYQTQKLKRDKYKLEHQVSIRTKQVQEQNKKLASAFQKAEKQHDNISFLMKELRHRVKNNLQIISSLLNIQANSVEDKSAIEALKMAKNRIVAISQIENKISAKNETVDIGEFIQEISEGIIRVLAGDENVKYKLDFNLEFFEVKSLNTTLIGLILNELITNVTKYAFDEYKDENKLRIGCSKHSNSLIIFINDNGKGYLSNTNTNSMGLELVNDMVIQMKGSIQIDSKQGTKNKIEIPL